MTITKIVYEKGEYYFFLLSSVIWGIFAHMKSFLIPTMKISPSVLHVKHSSAQSIFITLIRSLMVHIPIQNCLGTILFLIKLQTH